MTVSDTLSVRHLRYALSSPYLITADCMFDRTGLVDSLDWSLLNEGHLAHLAQHRKGTLGRYFECLVQTLFCLSKRYRILSANQKISKDKRDLGEIDLLIKDRMNNQVIHLELAVKFYLRLSGQELGSHAWIGPGCHDFLYRKLKHLTEKQLTLSARATEYWPQSLPLPDRAQLWVCGALFVEAEVQAPIVYSLGEGLNLNVDATVSVWREYSQELFEQGRVSALQKSDWITPFDADCKHQSLSMPTMVFLGHANTFEFAVPLGWGESAKAIARAEYLKGQLKGMIS